MPEFSDDDLRTALDALRAEPSAERLAVTARARDLRRQRVGRIGTGAVALGLVVAMGVNAIDGGAPDEVEIAIDDPTSTSTSPSLTTVPTWTTDPPGDGAEPWIQIWPEVVASGEPATITAVMRNPAASRGSVGAGCHGGELVRDGTTLDNDFEARADCTSYPVLPGTFSSEWTWTVPALPAGTYDVRGARLVVADAPPEPTDVVLTREEYLRFAGADLLSEPQVTIPDELVVLSGNRLALRFTTMCNRPAYDLRFRYESSAGDGTVDRVLVELRTAHFLVKDCIGEPSAWATVVDLPAPLRGAKVVATYFDPGPGADPAVVEATRASTGTPETPHPALATMDREPLSYRGLSTAACPPNAVCVIGWPGAWISLRPFDGCGQWIGNPITDDATATMYIQAYVPADNERCDGDWPPHLVFSTSPAPDYLFGGVVGEG